MKPFSWEICWPHCSRTFLNERGNCLNCPESAVIISIFGLKSALQINIYLSVYTSLSNSTLLRILIELVGIFIYSDLYAMFLLLEAFGDVGSMNS